MELCDAVCYFCAGFSKKFKKKVSFFLSHLVDMGKYDDICSQNDVKLSYGCYDTTFVALGNGLWKWQVFPFFDFEPY